MPMSGDLFGFLVSDLFPRSTSVSRCQLPTLLAVPTQQQLLALLCVEQIEVCEHDCCQAGLINKRMLHKVYSVNTC